MKKEKSNRSPKRKIDGSIKGNSLSQRVSQSVKDNIFKLADLTSKGAPDAAAELYSAAALAVGFLTQLCSRKRETFTEIAREKFAWPVMYDPHPEKVRQTNAFVRRLKVGTNTHINLSSGKTFSWDVPANVVAFQLHELAQSLRRAPRSEWTPRDLGTLAVCGVGISLLNSLTIHSYDVKYEKQLRALEAWGQTGAGSDLPALSKETASQWAKAAKKLFILAYGENFQDHPNLQELRMSVFGRAKNAYGETGKRGNIRKAMHQAVKQAWSSIAAVD